MFESLEQRRHLSVSAYMSAGDLYVTGDNNINGISVDKVQSNLVVKEYKNGGYQSIFSVPASSVNKIRIYGYDGNDTIKVHNSVTHTAYIHGGRGADHLYAGGGLTYMWGHGNWAGDWSGSHAPASDDNAADTLVTGTGTAIMYGQGGNDTFYFTSNASSDTYDVGDGGNGNDTFHLNGVRHIVAMGQNGNDTFKIYDPNPTAIIHGNGGTDTVDYSHFSQAVQARLGQGVQSGPKADASQRKQTIHTTVENLKGTQFSDWLIGNDSNNAIYGLGGHDLIDAQAGNDFVDAGDGNDTVFGGTGNDTLFGGEGHDGLQGDQGNDVLNGQNGNDSMWGSAGNDTLYGGNGNDVLHGEDGNDHLYGEAGHDQLYAGAGANLLVGGTGSDYLHAKNGGWADMLFGDNLNGTSNPGDLDVAFIDYTYLHPQVVSDSVFGVEAISW